MLRSLCKRYTALHDSDIETLLRLEETIGYIADLTGADVFIDCFYEDGRKCMVVAQAGPTGGRSLYGRSVVGEQAEAANEPAVFTVRDTGMPARDIRAITQENKSVSQVVVPVKNDAGQIIGVLIQEQDISDSVSRERKFEELIKRGEEQSQLLERYGGAVTPFTPNDNRLAMKEVHHRVKNNLQMIASILNLQARRSPHGEVRTAFRENVSRILSFAAIYDVLAKESEAGEAVPLLDMLGLLCRNVYQCAGCGEKHIEITAGGDTLKVDPEKATQIALVTNELVMNAVEHAFRGREDGGHVQVLLRRGEQVSTVLIADDGAGFDPDATDHIGLQLARSTVREKLGGTVRIHSDAAGSQVAFDFTN